MDSTGNQGWKKQTASRRKAEERRTWKLHTPKHILAAVGMDLPVNRKQRRKLIAEVGEAVVTERYKELLKKLDETPTG